MNGVYVFVVQEAIALDVNIDWFNLKVDLKVVNKK